MEFRILGPLEVLDEGKPLPLGGAKQRSALAMLLLARNQAVSRDRLMEGLWGASPPPTAAATLDTYLTPSARAGSLWVADERGLARIDAETNLLRRVGGIRGNCGRGVGGCVAAGGGSGSPHRELRERGRVRRGPEAAS